MEKTVRAFAKLSLNALYSKDPGWLFDPSGDLEAARTGKQTFVRSRTREGLVHTVDLEAETCTCEGFQFHGHCWHIEAAELAEIREMPPEWALEKCHACKEPVGEYSAFRKEPWSREWNGVREIVLLCLNCAAEWDEEERDLY